jgi:hypothetical protein
MYETVDFCDVLDEIRNIFIKYAHLKVHRSLSFLAPVVISIILAFRIDPREEELKKLRCISKGSLMRI